MDGIAGCGLVQEAEWVCGAMKVETGKTWSSKRAGGWWRWMVLVLSCRGAADVGKLPRHRRSLLGEDNARQEKRKSRWPCPRLIVRMGAHGKKIRRARRCGCLVRDGVESSGETHEAECVEREANPERRNSDTGLRSTYRTRRGNGGGDRQVLSFSSAMYRWSEQRALGRD